MRFHIYTPYEDILDPESGETLGEYRKRKATVYAREVFSQFTVASAGTRNEVVEEQTSGVLGMMGGRTRSHRRTVDVMLPVEEGELKPLPNEDTVRIGDLAEATE